MTKLFQRFVQPKDIFLFYLINRRRSSVIFDRLMHVVSRLFDAELHMLFMLLIFMATWSMGLFDLNVFIMYVAALITTRVIKRLFARLRPYKSLTEAYLSIAPPKDAYSFPSGHTCAAFSLALVAKALLPVVWPFFLILALLCGISRIYLGVHYPSDVLIGALIPLLYYVILI